MNDQIGLLLIHIMLCEPSRPTVAWSVMSLPSGSCPTPPGHVPNRCPCCQMCIPKASFIHWQPIGLNYLSFIDWTSRLRPLELIWDQWKCHSASYFCCQWFKLSLLPKKSFISVQSKSISHYKLKYGVQKYKDNPKSAWEQCIVHEKHLFSVIAKMITRQHREWNRSTPWT